MDPPPFPLPRQSHPSAPRPSQSLGCSRLWNHPMGRLGGVLESCWRVLGRLGSVLGAFGERLRSVLGRLEPSGSVLGAPGGISAGQDRKICLLINSFVNVSFISESPKPGFYWKVMVFLILECFSQFWLQDRLFMLFLGANQLTSILGPKKHQKSSLKHLGAPWERSGTSWGRLWEPLAHLGTSWAHLGNVLRVSCGEIGGVLGHVHRGSDTPWSSDREFLRFRVPKNNEIKYFGGPDNRSPASRPEDDRKSRRNFGFRIPGGFWRFYGAQEAACAAGPPTTPGYFIFYFWDFAFPKPRNEIPWWPGRRTPGAAPCSPGGRLGRRAAKTQK